jgi:hypothetical protein
VTVSVLLVQPALLARAVTFTDGTPPVAAWQAFTAPRGDRLAAGPERPDALAGVAGADVVAVAVDEVGRVGPLFGARFEREIRPVATTGREAFARSLAGADVLVACRSSMIGRWAAEDPAHLRLVSDPEAELAVWRMTGRPSTRTDAVPTGVARNVYCD